MVGTISKYFFWFRPFKKVKYRFLIPSPVVWHILTAQASRISNFVLQRSFFFFARMSCSEQSPFHGQASDRVWSFPNCSFKV